MTYVTNEDLLLMIILCGQQELATRIERFPEIKSRMYPSALSALSRDETEELIKYRWQVASRTADNPLPFQGQAIDQVFAYSRGLPRRSASCATWRCWRPSQMRVEDRCQDHRDRRCQPGSGGGPTCQLMTSCGRRSTL